MGVLMRRVLIGAGIAGLMAVGAATAAPAMGATPLTYRVTIENRTQADLTPVVYAVHDRTARMWRNGRRASFGMTRLAEDGVPDIVRNEVARRRGVRSAGVANRIAAGRSISFTVRTTTRHRRLSWASMLVCTNDGFTGQSSYALPLKRNGRTRFSVRVNARAYDGGSEVNDERSSSVPCLGAHGVGRDERRVIRRHPGISGRGDLTVTSHGWGQNAARVTIRRIR